MRPKLGRLPFPMEALERKSKSHASVSADLSEPRLGRIGDESIRLAAWRVGEPKVPSHPAVAGFDGARQVVGQLRIIEIDLNLRDRLDSQPEDVSATFFEHCAFFP